MTRLYSLIIENPKPHVKWMSMSLTNHETFVYSSVHKLLSCDIYQFSFFLYFWCVNEWKVIFVQCEFLIRCSNIEEK